MTRCNSYLDESILLPPIVKIEEAKPKKKTAKKTPAKKSTTKKTCRKGKK